MPNNRSKIYNKKMYYGGSSLAQTSEGNVTIGYAGVWDGTPGSSGWSSLDGGIQSGYGRGLYVVNPNHIYLFGKYSSVGQSTNLSFGSEFNLAKWNGSNWEAVGTLGHTNDEIKDVVYDSQNDILYAVGEFSQIYGVSANRVAKFQNGSWSALQGGANGNIHSCCLDNNGHLYVVGVFGGMTNAGFISNTMRIARWNRLNEAWEAILPGSVTGTAWDVSYDSVGDIIYVSGTFGFIGSVPNTKMIVQYHVATNTWSSIANFNAGGDSVVYDIEHVGDKLYIVGNFDTYGNDAAIYSNSSWTGLGMGDGYTLNPTQSSFVPIDLSVDSKGNLYVDRNAGGLYILKEGETQWNRLDQLGSAVDIGQGGGQEGSETILDTDMCFHPESVISTYQGFKKVKNLSAGDILTDSNGRLLEVETLITIFPKQPVKFFELGQEMLVTSLHLVQNRKNGRKHRAYLARLPYHYEKVEAMHHIQTKGRDEVYFVPVNSGWNVEVLGRAHNRAIGEM